MDFQDQLNALQASVTALQSEVSSLQIQSQAHAHYINSGPNVMVFLTSGTLWVVPTGVTTLLSVEAVGGGDGGGVNVGGGGSWWVASNYYTVTPGQVITYAIGQGGLGSTTSTQNLGGSTWFVSPTTLLANTVGVVGAPHHQVGMWGIAGGGAAGNSGWGEGAIDMGSQRGGFANEGLGGAGGLPGGLFTGMDGHSHQLAINATDGGSGTEWDGLSYGTGGGGGGANGPGTPGNGGLYGGGGGATYGGNGGQGIIVITYVRV